MWQLDSVLDARRTQGGVTTLPVSVAVPLIRSFEDKLGNANDPALVDIAKDLKALRERLDTRGAPVDGGHVANLLARIGNKTNRAAQRAGPAEEAVRSVGQQLIGGAVLLRDGRS